MGSASSNVTFADRRFLGSYWSGGFVIAKVLSFDGEVPRHEIKSTGEAYSRVALEHQLSPSFTIIRHRLGLPPPSRSSGIR
jgi:hypothetical protein